MPIRRSPGCPTDREIEVLRVYAATASTKEAACRLGISDRTVSNHLAHVRLRMGVLTTAQVIYIGRAAGWLVVPELEPTTAA